VVFWAAAVLSLASCTIVRVPAVIGLIGGAAASKKKAFLLTLSFVAALVLSYTLMGVLFSVVVGLGGHMMRMSRFLYYFAGIVVFLAGIQMAGLVRFKFFEEAVAEVMHPKYNGIVWAFLFGFVFVLF
jgi:cytochrome c biogenesis protein CcdA